MAALEWLFVIALVFYTVVIWWHKISKKLDPWMINIFGTAFTFDILGTVLLCVLSSKGWVWNLHSISGLASVLIMGAHFFWAIWALNGIGKWEQRFNRYSVYAWLLWLVAFISGIPI